MNYSLNTTAGSKQINLRSKDADYELSNTHLHYSIGSVISKAPNPTLSKFT